MSFIQDVYEYEKDHKCRFNYRLKYATDNDYRKRERDTRNIFILRDDQGRLTAVDFLICVWMLIFGTKVGKNRRDWVA